MKRTKFFFIAAALSFATVACDDDTTGTNAPAELDKQFMLAASDGGLFEINAGQVASSKGTTQTIKQFGQEMLDDHTSIKQELMKIAKDANVDLPTTLSNGKQQKLDSLSGLSGIAFDTTYIKMVTISHEEAVNLYEIQDKSASNVQLKTFAADKLPRLKAHLEKAKAMRDRFSKILEVLTKNIMFQSIIAIFETNEEAQKAKHALISHGFDLSQIEVNYNVDVEDDRSTDGQQTATSEHDALEEDSGSVVTVRTNNMQESLDATTILEDCGALDVNEFSAKPTSDPDPFFDPENLS